MNAELSRTQSTADSEAIEGPLCPYILSLNLLPDNSAQTGTVGGGGINYGFTVLSAV